MGFCGLSLPGEALTFALPCAQRQQVVGSHRLRLRVSKARPSPPIKRADQADNDDCFSNNPACNARRYSIVPQHIWMRCTYSIRCRYMDSHVIPVAGFSANPVSSGGLEAGACHELLLLKYPRVAAAVLKGIEDGKSRGKKPEELQVRHVASLGMRAGAPLLRAGCPTLFGNLGTRGSFQTSSLVVHIFS